MLSIKQFCEKLAVSRTTVLYYEREGLITPATRTESGYRQYGDKELEKFKTILAPWYVSDCHSDNYLT